MSARYAHSTIMVLFAIRKIAEDSRQSRSDRRRWLRVRVMYWKEIPVQVQAQDDGAAHLFRVPLDASASSRGLTRLRCPMEAWGATTTSWLGSGRITAM